VHVRPMTASTAFVHRQSWVGCDMGWTTHTVSVVNTIKKHGSVNICPTNNDARRRTQCWGTKNRGWAVVVLRHGEAESRRWKRCGVQLAGADKWSTTSTIVLSIGQGNSSPS
jgi:hypothetical protein